MDVDPLLARARQVWTGLAGSPISFPARQVAVAASANSSMCPPGWVGVVALGDAAICTVPTDDLVGLVTRACRTLPVDALTDPDRLSAVLPVAEVLGPAALAYRDDHSYRPHRLQATEQLPVHHPDLVDFLASVPAEDAAECGLVEITSAAYVLRAGTAIVAAAGYRHWPGRVAHLSVLTAPCRRGRGFARTVAAAATADGLAKGLLPQWRARPAASRRVARALGFRELGAQLSVRVDGRDAR
ncbi:GNAT family N-acetyltransferase [Verrucosispora sp. WMMA2044]|uniref:GNAT family N-acetyltransferase n=1 Tax=Verrucosispora sp. WMMA2044 TaxID=3016419 RepID=UPI00248C9CC7|nr:GNAT family N-acetyltransferase [Verrucosispora sp. WMMA2044]WBB51340.1 GNAT family N-acetyltransferase [Verrucosispora sp. WMMA2044]